jgi:processive 1,2-diacylglycerol beta-glucosyltransferase
MAEIPGRSYNLSVAMATSSPRVLILSASYGSGHNRVAQALAVAFQALGARVRVVDHFSELVHPVFDRLSRALYYAVLRKAPPLWGAAFWLGDQLPVHSPLLLRINRLGASKIERLLKSEPADLVVSVHPTPAGALAELKRRGRLDTLHATVIADFVVHTQWVFPDVDLYCVPADEIRDGLVARGVPPSKIVVTGIPVCEEFSLPADRLVVRQALGIAPRLPTVLVMAGANGRLGKLVQVCEALRDLPLSFQTLVVAGRNERLGQRLREIAAEAPGRLVVYGYVEGIHRFMAAADLLITKAGGVTMAEAFAAGLPLICYRSLPGQEARNERFAEMAGVALLARTPEDLKRSVTLALTDAVLLRKLRENIRLVARPEAARHVADALLGRIGQRWSSLP